MLVSIESTSENPFSIEIYDAIGKMIINEKNISPGIEFETGSGLKSGLYFIKVVQDGKIQTLKIVKN